MKCELCESSQRLPLSGVYNFQCVHCCARLVATAHPSKHMAKVMLAAIARFPKAPARQDILNQVASNMMQAK